MDVHAASVVVVRMLDGASGRLRNHTNQQTISLKQPSAAQFVKFVALSEARGNPWASVAELERVSVE